MTAAFDPWSLRWTAVVGFCVLHSKLPSRAFKKTISFDDIDIGASFIQGTLNTSLKRCQTARFVLCTVKFLYIFKKFAQKQIQLTFLLRDVTNFSVFVFRETKTLPCFQVTLCFNFCICWFLLRNKYAKLVYVFFVLIVRLHAPRNFIFLREQSGKSRAGKMGLSCPLV